MKKRMIMVVLAVCLLPGAALADIELNGFVESQERVGIAKDESAAEGDQEYPFDLLMADTWLDLTVRGTGMEDQARMFADVDLRHFALDRNEMVETRLREAWAGYYHDWFSFEFGKKIFIWGMADEMNPTDWICAEDLRWFMTYDKPKRKIGNYMATAAFSFSNFKVEGVWMPVFSPSVLPGSRQTWTPWKLQVFYDFVDLFPDYIAYHAARYPDNNIANSSGAFRFSGVVGPVDFELTAYDGWDHLPIFDMMIDSDPEKILAGEKPLVLREEYQRFDAFGGSLSGVAGPTTFRMEGAFYTDRWFMHEFDDALLNPGNLVTALMILRDLEGETFRSKKNSFNVVGGLDYRYGSLLYTNVQYFHVQILDWEDVLLDHEIENGISAKVEFTFLDETLKAAVDGVYNIAQEDWLLHPYLAYMLTDNLQVEGGVSLFGGDYETNFGEFDQNDFAYTKLRFSF